MTWEVNTWIAIVEAGFTTMKEHLAGFAKTAAGTRVVKPFK